MMVPKANFIPLDAHFGLVAHLGYHLLKPGSPRQFLVVLDYRGTIKWYCDSHACGKVSPS